MPLKPRNLIDEDDPRVSQIGHPSPPWLVNYADLMTEMVCFFIILYAVSAALNKELQMAKKELQRVMQEEKLQGEVKVTKDGMYVTLQEAGKKFIFESGSAELSPDIVDVMKKVAPTLQKLAAKHEILVEGHTDSIPTSRLYATNWELSTARATNVVRYLVQNESINPRHISAVGYGEYRPVAPNDTPEDRSKNRRVVFFVKNTPPPDVTNDKPPPEAE